MWLALMCMEAGFSQTESHIHNFIGFCSQLVIHEFHCQNFGFCWWRARCTWVTWFDNCKWWWQASILPAAVTEVITDMVSAKFSINSSSIAMVMDHDIFGRNCDISNFKLNFSQLNVTWSNVWTLSHVTWGTKSPKLLINR